MTDRDISIELRRIIASSFISLRVIIMLILIEVLGVDKITQRQQMNQRQEKK